MTQRRRDCSRRAIDPDQRDTAASGTKFELDKNGRVIVMESSLRVIGPAFGLVVGFHLTPLSAP